MIWLKYYKEEELSVSYDHRPSLSRGLEKYKKESWVLGFLLFFGRKNYIHWLWMMVI